MAEDVRVLLEELGWLKGDKVDIVGISLGGMIAMGEFGGFGKVYVREEVIDKRRCRAGDDDSR